MKVAIQGLGQAPATIESLLRKEKPDVTYIVCSDYQLDYVAKEAGYTKPNKDVITDVAKETKTRVIFRKCDVFDPAAVAETVADILREVKGEDEVIVNYTGGSAVVKLMLGVLGVALSSLVGSRVVYMVRYPSGFEVTADHTEVLRDIFKKLMPKR